MKNLFSLGLPLTDDIKKKAFTQNGKLRKGWYYDEYGLLTNGEEFYHSDKKSWAEYDVIRQYAFDKNSKKIDALYKATEMKDRAELSEKYHKMRDFEKKLIKKYKISEKLFELLKKSLSNIEYGRFNFYFKDRSYLSYFKSEFNFRKKNDFVEKVTGKDEFHLTQKGLQMFQEYKNFSDKLDKERFKNYKKFKKKYGLAAPQTELTTEYFKKMKVSELRAFTLEYYNKHLKGKTATIKKHLKEVVFVSSAGRKLLQPIYKEKVAVIEHLEELIKNSTYNNWGNRKKTDSPEVLGYLNFKSKLTIDGEKRHIRISVILDRERKTKFKTFEVGTKPKKRHSNPQGSRS